MRQMHSREVVMASAEHSAGTYYSDDQVNPNARGAHIAIDVTEVNSTNEQQSVQVKATGGTFKLTYSAQQTSALAFDISTADLVTALEALSNIGVGDVAVTGGPGDVLGTTPYVVTFQGALAATDVALMTADATSLTGGAHSVTIAEAVKGVAASSLVVTIQGKAPGTESYYDILASAAIATVTTRRLTVYPGVTAAANVAAFDFLPAIWRLKVVHTGDVATFLAAADLAA